MNTPLKSASHIICVLCSGKVYKGLYQRLCIGNIKGYLLSLIIDQKLINVLRHNIVMSILDIFWLRGRFPNGRLLLICSQSAVDQPARPVPPCHPNIHGWIGHVRQL
jgi:hypothetical protein